MLRAAFAALIFACLASATTADEPVDYMRQIKPILAQRCYACHGALKQEAELRLDAGALMRRGGDSGAAIAPSDAAGSLLVQRITAGEGERMPPEGEPLTDEQIALVKRWIESGAAYPADEQPESDPRDHWAFVKPVRPPLPRVENAGWSGNAIDAFVAAVHNQHGLTPADPAERATLLRRVYVDLTGLPPTRDKLHAFVADDSPGAYERVVDRLLANPAYGERWGRHWMDVWRYSDWYGRRAVPDVWNSAPQIWRWRDWIVNSLNGDKGYDRMLMEMLAADEIAPGDDEAAVATGFLVRNWYALNPNHWMRSNVEHTGKAFLGLRLNCAHCHDHKYDPISQQEYFRFRAFFEPLQLRQDRAAGQADPGPFQKYDYSVLRKVQKLGLVRVFDERLDAQTFMYHLGDERNRMEDKPPVSPAAPAVLGGDNIDIRPIELPAEAYYPGLKAFIQQDALVQREAVTVLAKAAQDNARRAVELWQQQVAQAEEKLAALQAEPAVQPVAEPQQAAEAARKKLWLAQFDVRAAEAYFTAATAQQESTRARILADETRYRGGTELAVELSTKAAGKAERTARLRAAESDVAAAKKAVAMAANDADVKKAQQQLTDARKQVETAAKALEAESDEYTPFSPQYPSTSSGRRAALARWIANRENPLTARVAVNHIWMRHFGRPLVESLYDFGRGGKQPSHPKLLDWLAVELMENGWSMKHIHRLIVTSNTYRTSSKSGGAQRPNLDIDPDNHYLWRFPTRRVEAEVVRDSVLLAGGRLDRKLGGESLENKLAPDSRRRSLYFEVYPEDGGNMKFLSMFDAPNPGECYRRTESIVPQQALTMTNSRLLLDQSRLAARRIWDDVMRRAGALLPAGYEPHFVDAAFEELLSRAPTEQERTQCLEFLRKQRELFRSQPSLPVDSDTATVGPSTNPAMRARESLVRVLFSHNDFVSIR